ELLALRDWLEGYGVTHVAMESTGVYWKSHEPATHRAGRVMSLRLTAQDESVCRSMGTAGRRDAGRGLGWCGRGGVDDDPGAREAPHIVASAPADSTVGKPSR